jgi:hypothetical protein
VPEPFPAAVPPLPADLAFPPEVDAPLSEELLELALDWITGAAEDAGKKITDVGRDLATVAVAGSGTAVLDLDPLVTRWRIEDLGAAEWAMRKLTEARAQMAVVDARAKEWRAPIDAWHRDAREPAEAAAAFFERHLELAGLAHREETGEATYWLPSGKVATVGVPAGLAIDSQEEVVAWAKEQDLTEVVCKIEVQVSRLAPAVTVIERDTGRTVLVQSCGCTVITTFGDTATEHARRETCSPGAVIWCQGCGADVTVEAHVPETAPAVMDAAGQEVPGLSVRPAYVNPTVTPGAQRARKGRTGAASAGAGA